MQNARRKLIIGLIIATTVMVIGSITFNIATSQEVSISVTSPNATISIQDAAGNNTREIGKGSAQVRLRQGDYAVRAVEGDRETRSLFSLKGGDMVKVTLTLAQLRQPVHISNTVVRHPIATSNELHYLNPAFSQLESYTFSTSQAQAMGQFVYGITDVMWTSPTTGYLQDQDQNFSYFDGTTATPLELGDTYYAAAGRSGALATFAKGTVTVRNAPGTTVAYRIKTDINEARMILGNQNRMLIYDTVVATEADITPAKPAVYQGQNKDIKNSEALKDLVISGGSWSPDGTKLAVSTENGVFILNTATGALTRLSITATTHANSFTWIDSQSGLFYSDQIIWRINTTTQTWEKLAKVTASVSTNEPFAVAPNGENAYFATDVLNSNGLGGVLYAISLK